jgi:hypothetical protein
MPAGKPDDPPPSPPVDEPATGTLTIPKTHPRLWWTPDRLARAKAWYARARFVPRKNDPLGDALVYVVTKDTSAGRRAVDALMRFSIPEANLKGVANDQYRWSDWVPLVYDWAHDQMTASERQSFRERYDHYVEIFSQKSWGGQGLEGNNYFWGYLRNELNWAIATYHEGPKAKELLDHALQKRWKSWFLPYAASAGRGGIPTEGSMYGRVLLQYNVVPFTSARLLGRDLYAETDFFREAVYYLIYGTTPAPTPRKGTAKVYHQLFPFADDEFDGGYPSAERFEYGDFMTTAAMMWARTPVGQHARHWLEQTHAAKSPCVAAVDPGGTGRDLSALPLDYYAPGPMYFYSRNRWGPKGTSLFYQLGAATHCSHTHLDAGTFQIWRSGEWVTKESTGYAQPFNGGMARDTICHNGLLFQNVGLADASPDGPPKVLRLESKPNYSYAVVDLSSAYRSHKKAQKNHDNFHAGRAVRELLFIRPLEVLVVLDRMEASGERMPAAEVEKTFLLHFPNKPQLDGTDRALAVNQAQALRVITLLPHSFTRRVVDESDFSGKHLEPSYYQYRLEETHKGSKDSCFIHVLQARDAHGKDVEARLSEVAGAWTVQLDHPTLGHAAIVFHQGMRSLGGTFAFGKDRPGEAAPLTSGVQQIKVTDQGPVWQER